jgi:hypothetical protein
MYRRGSGPGRLPRTPTPPGSSRELRNGPPAIRANPHKLQGSSSLRWPTAHSHNLARKAAHAKKGRVRVPSFPFGRVYAGPSASARGPGLSAAR